MKNAYLITSDLHKSGKNKANRINYVKEVEYVEDKLIEIANSYRNQGFNVIRLSLGDEFDTSYREVNTAMIHLTESIRLSKKFNKTYVTVGNHELTYYKNNPFWYLVNRIDSTSIQKSRKTGWVPKGVTTNLNVVDRLVDGEVEFLFNHYGSGIRLADPNFKTIGLFHQDVVFRNVLDEAKNKYGNIFELDEDTMVKKHNYVYLDNNSVLKDYQKCYYGHHHMLYGRWEDEDNTEHNYLASLGRTTHREVRDDFLERNVPVVLVEDGILTDVQDNYFNLMSRELCVKEELVKIAEEKYERSKEVQAIKKYNGSSDDPLKNVKDSLNDSTMSFIIDCIVSGIPDTYLQSVIVELKEEKINGF